MDQSFPYDFLIAGGGAAGLSLINALLASPLKDRSILLIEKDSKDQNDHTWCFWAAPPVPLDSIAFRSWNRLRFIHEDFSQVYELGDYRYNMVRGIDFYNDARQQIARHPQVTVVQGELAALEEQPQGVIARLEDGRSFTARWGFDSILRPTDWAVDPQSYHVLKQHFKGWEIETAQDVFDPATPILFDFRTPQLGGMRFCYVLPHSPRRALVEYTLFTPDLLTRQAYEEGLRDYLRDVLHIEQYRIRAEENGVIPMTDRPFARQLSAHVLAIGTKGGRVKPSTGYAFLRIQRDSAAIVRSLQDYQDPFHLPETPWRYRFFDTIMLQVMLRQGALCKPIFTDLFRNNPIERIFRFLDESGSWSENFSLLASLPPRPFLRALFKVYFQKQI